MVDNAGNADTGTAIADKWEARDFCLGIIGEDGMQRMRLLVTDDKIQYTLDKLQRVLNTQPDARIVMLPVVISLPKLIS